MRISNLKAFVLPLALALVSGVAASAQIVADGNFNWSDSGSPGTYYYAGSSALPSDWTFVAGTGIQTYPSAWGFSPAPGSPQSAFIQNGYETGGSTISQTVNLTPGDYYTLTFYLEQRPGYGADPISVTIGGDTLFSSITPPDNDTWTKYTVTFEATSTSELLTFAGLGGTTKDNGTGLADVSIHVVPEGGASSAYLLFAGLVCFGAIFTSRKGLANRA